MPIRLDDAELRYLETLARGEGSTDQRREALVVLSYARGEPLQRIVEIAGISESLVKWILKRVEKRGLTQDGLGVPGKLLESDQSIINSVFAKTPRIEFDRSNTLESSFTRFQTQVQTDRDPLADREGKIERTRGICGESARIAGTRIPVWTLVEARDLGMSNAQLLLDYPGLDARDLTAAWNYADRHSTEIAMEIQRNEMA